MKSVGLVCLFAVLVCLCVCVSNGVISGYAQAQIPTRELEAEGKAVGSDLKAKDEALNRALRNAVEQGVGVLIDSETIVKRFRLLDDKVYSHVKGYVTEYTIINDNKGQGGVYEITIRAQVALALLEKDLKALNILKARKNNPRVMVIIPEYIEGGLEPSETANTEVESIFLSKDFPLIDSNQMEIIKDQDAASSYDNPEKAAALGKRHGAEIVIVGKALCDASDVSMPYGVSVYAFSADVMAKAVKTDTAKIVASGSASALERGGERMATARLALKKASQQLGQDMLTQIVEAWRHEAYNNVSLQLIGEAVDLISRDKIREELASIRGVLSVDERSYKAEILILDVEMEGALWNSFEDHLRDLQTVSVRIKAKTQNRIDFVMGAALESGDEPSSVAVTESVELTDLGQSFE